MKNKKKLYRFSYDKNMANFEAFLYNMKLSKIIDFKGCAMCLIVITITTYDIFQCLKANRSAIYYCSCTIVPFLAHYAW